MKKEWRKPTTKGDLTFALIQSIIFAGLMYLMFRNESDNPIIRCITAGVVFGLLNLIGSYFFGAVFPSKKKK